MNRIGAQGKRLLRAAMSHHRLLPDPFVCLRLIAGAALFACAVLIAAPPAALAQDDPVTEDTVPDEVAPEEAAPNEDVAPEEEEAAPEEAAPEEAGEAAPEEAASEEAKPWDVSKPCDNVQHPYQADLCQQWRAAQAAEATAAATEHTARSARLLTLLGMVATLLLLLMFVPLLMAVRAARKAARGPEPAPAADETREEELRAYVDVDKLEFIETPESEGIVKVKVTFRNTGQTPAFKTKSITQVGIRDVADEDLVPEMPLPDRAKDSARPRLGHDATAVDIVECDSTPSLADRVINGDASIVVWGFAEYMDVFDRRRRTAFQYLCNADTLDSGEIFKPMARGDEER
jgi:hypothetical protein